MMTNSQCQSYAIIALQNLIRAGKIKVNDKNIYKVLDHELYYVFDTVGEEEAEEKADIILQGQ
jgi:hypothetical protein